MNNNYYYNNINGGTQVSYFPLQEVIYKVKENSRDLQIMVERLENNVKKINTIHDSKTLRGELAQIRQSSNQLIEKTHQLVKTQTKDNIVTPSDKLLRERIFQEFSEVVSRYKSISIATMQKENAFPLNSNNNYHQTYANKSPSSDHVTSSLQSQNGGLKQMYASGGGGDGDDIVFEEVFSEDQIDKKITEERDRNLKKINLQLRDLRELSNDLGKIVELNSEMLDETEKNTVASASISNDCASILKKAPKFRFW